MTAAADRRPRPHLLGRLMLRLAPGEGAPNIQSLRDIRRGTGTPSLSLGSATVDRTIRGQTSGMLVARAYPSAARLDRPFETHRQYDAVEERIGLSRTFRVAVSPDVDVHGLSARLLDLDAVESASPMYLSETPFSDRPTREPSARPGAPYELIGADRALAMEPGDGAVLLGLVDSGVALAHPELGRCLRPGVDTVALDAEAMPKGMKLLTRSSALRQGDPEDYEGHGTAVTSIMAARGLFMHPGVAGASALVIPGKALAAVETEGGGVSAIGSLPDIDHAVKLVIDLGARVINMSFGTPASALDPHDPIPHEEIVRYALARGCILVAASGNNGDDDPFYPAALPGVIAVGAVDGQGRPSKFSSYGPHVALCAPGEGIQLAALTGYATGAGTSFAAPFVTAASALLVARALRQSTPLDSDDVRRLLCRSARPFARGLSARGCGAGILDIPAALRAVDDEVTAGALGSEGGLTTSKNTGSLHPTSHN